MSNLKVEKHPDFDKLNYCFRRIEELAETHGLEVDELIEQPFDSGMNPFLIEQKLLAANRMKVLRSI